MSDKSTPEQLRAACLEFIDAIEATGGLTTDEKGYYVPVGDPEWLDLGEAYQKACAALGQQPMLAEDDSDNG